MRLPSFLLTATVLASSLTARADSFTFTGAGVNDTFTLPSSPTVSASGTFGFSVAPVLVDENGFDAIDQIFFFSKAEGGGLLLEDTAGNGPNGFGAQLYSGGSNDPTFKVGTFALSDLASYTLTISDTTAVPEPSTLVLLGAGLIGFVVMRRRLIVF